MTLRLPKSFILPLATFAFLAVSVTYFNTVFTTSTRWVFLALLILFLLVRRGLLVGLTLGFGAPLFAYCAWCMSTYTWSEVPNLSLAKAIAFTLVAAAFVSAGYAWVYERGSRGAIYYLLPVTVLGLFACSAGASYNGGQAVNLEYLQGLTYNPNMLGSLLAMALPVLLWNAYKYRATPQIKWVWFALLAFASITLVRTHSRASMLAAAFLFFGFVLSLKLRGSHFILIVIAGLLLLGAAAGTTIVDVTYSHFVLKGYNETEGLWQSRIDVWRSSYEGARKGGWLGLGYGVSAGDTTFNGGLTSVGYGREKGNAQLAIIEETGLIGLALYAWLLFALFRPLISSHRRQQNPDLKVELGIVIGSLAGMTAMSIFEAWWVSPGSPESAYFWSVAGLGLGMARFPHALPASLRSNPMLSAQAAYSMGYLQRGERRID